MSDEMQQPTDAPQMETEGAKEAEIVEAEEAPVEGAEEPAAE